MFAIGLISIFLVSMIAIGFWGMRKTATLNDFFLGGRTIGPWMSAFAYGTTYFSAVIFIGFAGQLGWGFGLNALWVAAGNAVFGSLLAWFVLGSRTRRMTQNLNAMTMPEFLRERYEAPSLKIFSAFIIFVFLLPYSASVFKGLGHLFEVTFGIPYEAALLAMIIITGIYLVMGGYFAVTLTDFVQGIIMIVGAIAMVVILIMKSGGIAYVIPEIATRYAQHVPAPPGPGMLWPLVFMTSFGVWGLPQMVQKFYAVKDESVIRKAAIATFVFAVIISFAAYFTGSLAHLFYDSVPLNNGRPDFDRIVPGLLVAHLPQEFMAVILLLILSASMSTLSSLILVSASAVAIDLYKGHIRPDVSKERSLAMMRFLSAIFVVLSYFIASKQVAFIVTLMSLSWGAVAGSFMAPLLYGLYWKRTSRTGVISGVVSALIVSIGLFFLLGAKKSPVAASLGMIVPFVVIPLVSLFTPPPGRKTIEKAFGGIGGQARSR